MPIPLAARVENANYELQRVRDRLISELACLAERCSTEAKRLHDDPTRTVNSLGIVQGNGQSIDLLCAELTLRQEFAKTLANTSSRSRREKHPNSDPDV